jgi:hypothetical protein
MKNLNKIDNLEEIVSGTKQQIKKYRTDNEAILNRLRELDEGVLPFSAQEKPEPESEPEEEEEEEDLDVEVETELPTPPSTWLPQGA